jgi:hypothetical protein
MMPVTAPRLSLLFSFLSAKAKSGNINKQRFRRAFMFAVLRLSAFQHFNFIYLKLIIKYFNPLTELIFIAPEEQNVSTKLAFIIFLELRRSDMFLTWRSSGAKYGF